jgi:hypothetical protein
MTPTKEEEYALVEEARQLYKALKDRLGDKKAEEWLDNNSRLPWGMFVAKLKLLLSKDNTHTN